MKTICLLVCLMALSVMGLLSCTGVPSLEGTYAASRPGPESGPVVLVLADGGKGSWSLEGEAVELRWEARGGKVLLHTRSGGVIAGTVSPEGAIDISLPGVGSFRFVKRAGDG
ncbi:MAG: hypothetical protein ABIL58_03160 [Pseudomonadota bacterium]